MAPIFSLRSHFVDAHDREVNNRWISLRKFTNATPPTPVGSSSAEPVTSASENKLTKTIEEAISVGHVRADEKRCGNRLWIVSEVR